VRQRRRQLGGVLAAHVACGWRQRCCRGPHAVAGEPAIAKMKADGTLTPEEAEEAKQEERRRYRGSPVAVSE